MALAFLLLLFLLSPKDICLAACDPSVNIDGTGYGFNSIQNAYNYASSDLGLSSFTLLLTGEIFTEDLTLNGGAVILDGGYNCTFTTKDSISRLLGTITISTGSANFAGDLGVVSTTECAFDIDSDGFTRIGSCSGSMDDCNDSDPNINPGVVELCDGIDNNCNGQIDEGLTGTDADGDGYYAYGSCGAVGTDCNDADFNIHPDALDIPYDGIDQDCSGADLTFAGETCGVCHYLPTIANFHDLTTPPDGTCVSCHASQVGNVAAGHYGKTVKTAGNNMVAGEIITCTACHDQSEPVHGGGQIGANGNGSDYVTNKLIPAWSTDPPSITCDTCHEDRAAAHNAAHDHRVITAICTNCHTSDTTILGQPGSGTLASASDVDTLHRSDCTLCHGYSGTKLDSAVVAQAIRDGIAGTDINCLTCHTNFETVHAFLDNHNNLVQVGTTSCGNCHSDPPPLTDPVDPKVHSSCSNCHDADYNRISLAAGKSFAVGGDCTTCHTNAWETIHTTNPPDHSSLVQVGTTGCGNCHSDPPPLTDATDPKVHNACTTCHNADGSLRSLAVGKDFLTGGDCTTCHTATWEVTHTTSPPDHSALVTVGTTSCGNCHSDPPPLTDATDPKVHHACTTCHDATSGALVSLAVGKSFTGGGD
ncbi:MAG TPA: MopE-related protein, partial [Geothermobacteraceae bacterium]|nr:MopE-related protein [Geothermobacteraceae bacterium]